MADILLKDKDGLTRAFKISGDTPTQTEQARIDAILNGTPAPSEQNPEDDTGILSAFAQGAASHGINDPMAGAGGLAGLAAKHSASGRFLGSTPEEWEAYRKEQEGDSEGYWRPQGSFFDQEGFYNKARFLAYQAGVSAPTSGAAIAGAYAGAPVGATVGSVFGPVGTVVGGGIGGAIGAGIASLPVLFEGNLQEQEQKYGKVVNPEKAFKAAIPQALLEGTADRLTLGAAGLIGKAVPSVAKGVVEKATKGALLTYAKRVGEPALVGMTAESVTEAVQQGIQRWQADKPLGDAEAQREYLESAIVGGLLGLGMGGGEGVVGATLEAQNRAKIKQIKKDLDEADGKTGDFRKENRKARIAQAGSEISKEDEVSLPLLEDLRAEQDLIEGPEGAVSRPVPEAPKEPPKKKFGFTVQEYSDAVAKVTGEKVVSAALIKKRLGLKGKWGGQAKADAIFEEMIRRGDGIRKEQQGRHLVPVDKSTSGNVEEEAKAKGTVTRRYEVRKVSKEETSPFQIRRASDGKTLSPNFKTAEEAYQFADAQPNLGDYSVVENQTPHQYGVYEVTSGVKGVKPTARLSRTFADNQSAINHANSLNPSLSPETNEEVAKEIERERLKKRVAQNFGRYQPHVQALVDKLAGPGRVAAQVVRWINAPNDKLWIEGKTDRLENGMRRLQVATDIFDAGLSPEQRQEAINSVAHHEIIHVLKQAGLFTKQQWNLLSKRANARVRGKNYTYLERSQVRNRDLPRPDNMTDAEHANLINEEAIAEMFRDYMRDPTAFTGEHRSMLRRMADFIRTLGQYARSVREGDDVLADIAEGKVGRQEADASRAEMYGPYYSSVRINGFYLKSAKFFENIAKTNPDQTNTGQKWIGYLRNDGKISDDELTWLGLKDWLNGQKQVSVRDILQYIGANSLDIQEKIGDTPYNEYSTAVYNERIANLEDRINDFYQGDVNSDYFLHNGGYPAWEDWNVEERTPIADDIEQKRRLIAEKKDRASRRTWHDRTTQLGGEDYTEIAIHMPHLEPKYRREGHFNGLENIIASVRFKTRTFDGKKTLAIEEIQGDLHQDGKQNGYFSRSDLAHYKALKAQLDETEAEAKRRYDEWVAAGAEKLPDDHPLDLAYAEFDKKRMAILKQMNALRAMMRIPDAPFKTTWHELALKRLLRYAAENGYDAITWHAEPEGVAQTENHWGQLQEAVDDDGKVSYATEGGRDVTNIVNFYTKRMPRDFPKLLEKLGFDVPVQVIEPVGPNAATPNLEDLFDTPDDFHMLMQEVSDFEPDMLRWTAKARQIVYGQKGRRFDPMEAIRKSGMPMGRLMDVLEHIQPNAAKLIQEATQRPTLAIDPQGNPNLRRYLVDVTPEMKSTAKGEGFPLWDAKYSAVSKRKAPDTPEFRSWFAGSKIVGDDGQPLVLYHGALKDFDRFKRGSVYGAVGAGHYFTDTPDDAANNYASPNGPDHIFKMQKETDELLNAGADDAEIGNVDNDGIGSEVRKRYHEHEGAVYPVYLSIKKPLTLDFAKSTHLTPSEVRKMINAAYALQNDYLNLDADDVAAELQSMLRDQDTNAEIMSRDLQRIGGLMDAMDPDTGDYAAKDIISKMWEAAGYDGIILKGVSKRWWLMGHMNEQTTHYIAFQPTQVKSIFNTGPYSKTDPRISYSAVSSRPLYSASAPMGQRVPAGVPRDLLAQIEERVTYNNIAPALEKLFGFVSKYGGSKVGFTKEHARRLAEGSVITLQDVAQPLAKLVDRVRKNGGSISDETDPYLNQQLMTGFIETRIKKAEKALIGPLEEAVSKLHVTQPDMDELLARHPSNIQTAPNGTPYEKSAVRNILLDDKGYPKLALATVYIYAQHAKERNAEMRRRNERLQDKRPEQYDSGSGMSDAEADDVLAWFASKPFAREFSDLTNPNSIRTLHRKLIAATNDIRVQHGLTPDYRNMIDPETGAPVDPYQDYAILRGYTENNPDHVDDPLTKHFAARAGKRLNLAGKEDRSATGRTSEASNLIANAVLQHIEAIVRAQKNEVAKSFLNMIRNNMGITLDNGPNLAANQMSDFAEVVPLTVMKPVYDSKSGLVRMAPHPQHQDPDIMVVKDGGKQIGIKIKDARLRNALLGNTLLGDTGQRALINGMLKLNRFLAAVRTSYNIDFIPGNFFKDFGAAHLNLTELEIKGLRSTVLKTTAPAIRGVYRSVRDHHANDPWRAVFEDFAAHGGKTSYMGQRDLESVIDGQLDKLSTDPEGNYEKIKDKVFAVGRLVEASNDAIENGVRVATYKALVDKMLEQSSNRNDPAEIERIKKRAAERAKNLTVNFNMGGSQKPLLNALYLFFNAGIQGSAALANPLIRSQKVRRLWIAAIAAGALQDLILSAISGIGADGEKEYDKIPDYVLETHMILLNPFSESGYIKIPLPFLFNAAFNSGRAIMRGVRGGYTAGETINSVLGTAISSLNPFGGGGTFINWVMPTVADPFVELYNNTNFMGTPIAPEKSPFSATDLPAQRYWNNTSGFYKTMADVLDKATGGDGIFKGAVSFSPNQYEHVVDFLGGGAASSLVRAWGMVSPNDGNLMKLAKGDEVSANDVPFFRRFIGNVTSREDMTKYVANRDRVLSVREALKDALKDGDSQKYQDIIQNYPEEYRAAAKINAYESRRRKISAQIKRINESKRIADADKKKMVEPLKKQQEDLVNMANFYMRGH